MLLVHKVLMEYKDHKVIPEIPVLLEQKELKDLKDFREKLEHKVLME